jgi:hypothetical protein
MAGSPLIGKLHRRALLLLPLLSVFAVGTRCGAADAKPTVTVTDPHCVSGKVTVTRYLDQNPLECRIQLTATGGTVSISGEQHRVETADECIADDHVTVTFPAALADGVPAYVKVRLFGVARNENCTGQVHLTFSNANPLTIDLALAVVDRRRLEWVPANPAAGPTATYTCQIVQPGAWPGLARTLVPQAWIDRLPDLAVRNPSRVGVTPHGTAVEVAAGNGSRPRDGWVTYADPAAAPLRPGDTTHLGGTLVPGMISAGHYTGHLRVGIAGSENVLDVPVDISVRNPPLLPVLLTIPGVILGMVLKRMRDIATSPSRCLTLSRDVSSRADAAAIEPEDRRALGPALESLRAAVAEANVSETQMRKARVEVALRQLESARSLVRAWTEQNRQTGLDGDESRDPLVGLQTAIRMVDPPDAGATALKDLHTALSKDHKGLLPDIPAVTSLRQPSPLCRRAANALGLLCGVPVDTSAQPIKGVLSCILAAIVFLGLWWAGVSELYIVKGVTFGAQGISDYIPLALWGLGAQAAGSAVGNLTWWKA